MTPKQEKYLTEKYIRPMVRKMLRENDGYSPFLKGPNDFYKLKSFFSMNAPKDWNHALINDDKFMKMCQTMVTYLESTMIPK